MIPCNLVHHTAIQYNGYNHLLPQWHTGSKGSKDQVMEKGNHIIKEYGWYNQFSISYILRLILKSRL